MKSRQAKRSKKKLAEATRNNAVADFLKEQGCETTAEEFIAAVKDHSAELSDEKLAPVTGGANLTEALLSVMSVGIGCAVASIVSVAIDDGAEKTEGRLLCEKASTTIFSEIPINDNYEPSAQSKQF